MAEKLIILGSAVRGGALLILDSLKRSSNRIYDPVGILDDTEGIIGTEILGVKVIGGLNKLEFLRDQKFFNKAIIAVGNVKGRDSIFQLVKKLKIDLANIVDDSVLIRSNVNLGNGNVIMAECNFGPYVSIGDNNFIGTRALIEHESIIGYGNSFGVSCVFAGRVKIGNLISFGSGSGAKADTVVLDEAIIASGTFL